MVDIHQAVEIISCLNYLEKQTEDKCMPKKDNVIDNDYITITPKQIRSVLPHTDQSKIDRSTGKRLMIARVRVPSANFRSHRFGTDKNGIDLDDRAGFLNIPSSMLGLNLTYKDGNKLKSRHEQYNVMLGEDRKLIDRKTGADVSDKYKLKGIYMYVDTDRKFRVHFESKCIGDDESNGVKTLQFDRPEAKDVPGNVICDMYHEAVQKSEEIRQQKEQQKDKNVDNPGNSKEKGKNQNTKTEKKKPKQPTKKKSTRKKEPAR